MTGMHHDTQHCFFKLENYNNYPLCLNYFCLSYFSFTVIKVHMVKAARAVRV